MEFQGDVTNVVTTICEVIGLMAIDGIYRIEEMRADQAPDEFLTRMCSTTRLPCGVTALPTTTVKICFSFPYISWCSDMYVDADEPITILVEETWEEAALDIEFDMMKKGLI